MVAVADRVAGETPALGGVSYLALALLAQASASGRWCAVVGAPTFGIAAAAGLGVDLSKVLLLDHPGERWPEAVAVLSAAVDVILPRPPTRPTAEDLRRIGGRLRTTARQRGCALIVAGSWGGAHVTLRTMDVAWMGLGSGRGHLTGRRVTVISEGRGAAGRARAVRLLRPNADGRLEEQHSAIGEHAVPGGPQDRAGLRIA